MIFEIVRILTPEQAVLGFSNTATVTVAAMFVLSAGLVSTRAWHLRGGPGDR